MWPQNISFCKQLHKSELAQKFCFHLPWKVCQAHLPSHDHTIILVDEFGKEYSVKNSVEQNRLQRGGWKEFAISHGLMVGDILVFHMIDPCKFKVHITRAGGSVENKFQNNKPANFVEREDLIEENGNTVKLMKIEDSATDELSNLPSKNDSDKTEAELKAALGRIEELKKQCDVGIAPLSSFKKPNGKLLGMEKGSKPLEDDDSEEEMVERMLSRIRKRVREEINLKEKSKHVCIRRSRSTETNDSDGDSSSNVRGRSNYIRSVAPLGTENSESALNFKDTKGFENFKIRVNGETLDSKIPADIRIKYYQLCCIQNNFIHDRVMKGLNSKLVVAMILEIVSIVDSTKAANISTSQDLECFGKALKSFEDLGMSVGSLRAKIGKLIEISSEHQSFEESTRVKFAEIESKRTALLKKTSKIDELLESAKADGELIGDLEAKANTLKEKREKLCAMFKEVAGLTW